jgi:hypothetical protein
MHRILIWPDIRPAGYLAKLKTGYRISGAGRIPPDIRDPDPGWTFSGSRISDPGSGPIFDEIFLQYLQNPCYVIFITLAYS